MKPPPKRKARKVKRDSFTMELVKPAGERPYWRIADPHDKCIATFYLKENAFRVVNALNSLIEQGYTQLAPKGRGR